MKVQCLESKTRKPYNVDRSNELLSRVEIVNLAMEGEAFGLAEENFDVTIVVVATELCSQPEHSGIRNELHSKQLLEASIVSVSAGIWLWLEIYRTGKQLCGHG